MMSQNIKILVSITVYDVIKIIILASYMIQCHGNVDGVTLLSKVTSLINWKVTYLKQEALKGKY